MSGTADPGKRPPGWTEEDEAWVQSALMNNRADPSVIADVIEATGADSFRIGTYDLPAGDGE